MWKQIQINIGNYAQKHSEYKAILYRCLCPWIHPASHPISHSMQSHFSEYQMKASQNVSIQ